jgi:alcohol dehydrogenase
VLDPLLSVSCPKRVTAYSGMDALSHAIEALVAVSFADRPSTGLGRVFVGKNPVSDPLALRAIELIGANLRRAYRDGSDLDAREGMLLGSLLAGMAFANAGTGLVHALQYPLGARTHTAHGLGNALLLPAAMRFNAEVRASELARIGLALGAGADPAAAITEVRALADDLDIPADLRAIGVVEDDLADMAGRAIGIERLIRLNPRPVTVGDLETILRDAWGDAARAAPPTTIPPPRFD